MERKLLFVTVAALVAVIVALLAGILMTLGGAGAPTTILTGVAAFGATLSLVLRVMSTLGLV
ncbi:hypothetical protein HNR23_004405 [Nocardiopsis mwathae]|uniref:Uncharacterized protein n=1 Tax=Nocardiopsis mwathae TaxID=1472723 RepID=A0A7W9YLT2_9ACTN|nr:hypothetical protein [Nocardiopsis mwathae]MBB6174345.1 hypothetical protein [Nocardiopsis mwathae]